MVESGDWYRSFSSLADYRQYLAAQEQDLRIQAELEKKLVRGGLNFVVPGFCYTCQRSSRFRVTDSYAYELEGQLMPNWREHLRCRSCGLNNRMRASVHLFLELLKPDPDSTLYLTEQVTPMFEVLGQRFLRITGSEYLRDGTPGGTVNAQGIRHEDLSSLSFQSDSFDIVLSFDVCEHIPNYRRGFEECFRVLRPWGALFFSVPFLSLEQETLVRAAVEEDGSIRHLQPPEYHGDPCSEKGCLAFYQFGWDLLDLLRKIGFSKVQAYLYWSQRFAYLGRDQIVFVAQKGPN